MLRFTRVRAALPLALIASLAGTAALTSPASARPFTQPAPIIQEGTTVYGIVGTAGAQLIVRAAPTTSSRVIRLLPPTMVFSIACQTTGSLVRQLRWDPRGSLVWDRIILGERGVGERAAYVSDAYVGTPVVNAPTDAAHGYRHGIPNCKGVQGLTIPIYNVSAN